MDFVALLLGYALSGERTLHAFFDRLRPFADLFMALFERETMPHRASLSRFLGAVDTLCLEALRSLLLQASFTLEWARETIGGLQDRSGNHSLVFASAGTREAARQR
jgi:hypothetical protein